MALTAAEKQRHYRERLKPKARSARYRSPRDQRSRPELWYDAVATLVTLRGHCSARLDKQKGEQTGLTGNGRATGSAFPVAGSRGRLRPQGPAFGIRGGVAVDS